jgi:mannonate dehydratase
LKIGLGLYRESLTPDNFRFARQAGATHIVAHLTNYFSGRDPSLSSGNDLSGWGDCSQDRLWTYDEMSALVGTLRENGLQLGALENFSPKFWSDVLLDGPDRDAQIEGLKRLISDAGRAGVPCIGYNFSLAGVWGWKRGPFARGDAMSVGLDLDAIDPDEPIPDGVVWNMRYRPARAGAAPVTVSDTELWQRLEHFLREIVPVAEEAGIRLAAHPDDPVANELRRTARLVNRPEKYDRLSCALARCRKCRSPVRSIPMSAAMPRATASAISISATSAARSRNITRPSWTRATSTWPKSSASCATKTTTAC